MIMRPGPDDDIIDADFVDEYRAAGQQLHDLLRQVSRSQYTPPPPNTVPAKPWKKKNFGWTNSPGSEKSEAQTGQPYLRDMPHFVHLEEDTIGDGIKGAFYLSRRIIIVTLFLFMLMLIGAQSVPDIVELIFSFV
jgi:hypothetical protein